MALDSKSIGQRIKYYRSELGLSQEQLGNLVFASREYISYLENGSKNASLEVLVMIANALEVSANDLLADNLTHQDSDAVKEVHEIFFDCNKDEKDILIKTLQHLKALLSEHGI